MCKTESQWEFGGTQILHSVTAFEGWDGVGGGREVHEWRNLCVPMADSCWCMAETNTIFKKNYPPIKNKTELKKKKKPDSATENFQSVCVFNNLEILIGNRLLSFLLINKIWCLDLKIWMNYIMPNWVFNPFEMIVEHVSQDTEKQLIGLKQFLDQSTI